MNKSHKTGKTLIICPLPVSFFHDFWKQHPLPDSTTLISHQYSKKIEQNTEIVPFHTRFFSTNTLATKDRRRLSENSFDTIYVLVKQRGAFLPVFFFLQQFFPDKTVITWEKENGLREYTATGQAFLTWLLSESIELFLGMIVLLIIFLTSLTGKLPR